MIGKIDHSIGERHRLSTELAFSNGLLEPPSGSRRSPTPALRTITSPPAAARSSTCSPPPPKPSTPPLSKSPRTRRAAVKTRQPFPVYQLEPYLGMGRSYPMSSNAHNIYTWTDGLSTRWRKHSLRVVARYSFYQVNTFWPQYPDGLFQFYAGLDQPARHRRHRPRVRQFSAGAAGVCRAELCQLAFLFPPRMTAP